jgi:Zn-dependent protease with chaperone function
VNDNMHTNRLVLLAVLSCLVVNGAAATSFAAERPPRKAAAERQQAFSWAPLPFADPEKFFEQFFGLDADAERRLVENVVVTADEERTFGGQALQAFLGELRERGVKLSRRGADIDYLRRLVDALRPLMLNQERYPSWTIWLAESEEFEAKCFPGGHLVFFRGLLDDAESEAALIGVVAHELSHVGRGHQLNTLRRWKAAQQTWSGHRGADPRAFFQNGMLLTKALMRPFRPEDEAEADRDAATWCFQIGYDPRPFAELLLKLQARNPGLPAAMPAFLRSHPAPADRHRAVLEVYERLRATAPDARLYIGRENLRRRVTRAQHEFPE